MNTKKLRSFTLFVLFCGLICIASTTVKAQTGRFRVVLNGYRVTHQTLEGGIDNMGWGDEVTLVNHIGTVDSSGILRRITWGNTFTTIMGSTQVANTLRAGTASSTGGLQTGDDFPTANPAVRTMPIRSGNPPATLFEGELTRNANAAVIIPTIWEWDGSTPSMQNAYAGAMDSFTSALTAAVRSMITRTASSSINAFLRSGSTVGIGNTITLDYGLPMTRPIGVQSVGNRFGFTPQVLVLTYDQADLISRTEFVRGLGVGVIPVTYTDASLFQGEYRLFIQVERTDQPAACPTITSNFRGTATMTTTNTNFPGPYTADVNMTIEFSNCRTVARITNFTEVATLPFNVLVPGGGTRENITRVTQTGGGTGMFEAATGQIRIPVTLHFRHTLEKTLGVLALPSDLTLTLTTEGAGGRRLSNGHAILVGSGVFAGGVKGGTTGNITVAGNFTPSP